VVNGALINERLGSQGALSGFRNRIINGACDIAQRGSVVVPNSTAVYGGPDRFIAINVGAAGQFTQSQSSMTFQGVARKTVRQTVNTAVTSIAGENFWFGIAQFLEGFNTADLRGKAVSASFLFNTNVTGTYSVSLRDSTGSQSYVSTFSAVANTPLRVSVPILAIPLASTIPASNGVGLTINIGLLNTGAFQAASTNAWVSGNFASAAGATNWGATAGNFIELTELQLEEGSVATPFERRSYGVELVLCQRYYQRNPLGTGALGSVGQAALVTRQLNYAATLQAAYAKICFAVQMRSNPTVRFFYDVSDGGQLGPSGAAVVGRDGFFTDASLTLPSLQFFDINDWEASAEL
jgi:hypothetical protein